MKILQAVLQVSMWLKDLWRSALVVHALMSATEEVYEYPSEFHLRFLVPRVALLTEKLYASTMLGFSMRGVRPEVDVVDDTLIRQLICIGRELEVVIDLGVIDVIAGGRSDNRNPSLRLLRLWEAPHIRR